MSRRAKCRQRRDARYAVRLEHPCGLAQGGACGHHIVDQSNVPPDQRCRGMHRKRPLDVRPARIQIEFALAGCMAMAHQRSGHGCDAQLPRKRPCDFPCLIEAALGQTRWRQRNGDDQVRRGAGCLHTAGQLRGDPMRGRQFGAELEPLDQRVERIGIVAQRKRCVDGVVVGANAAVASAG